ncbi:hypothetical protein DM01DRAFT_1338969 [Hesseltinella vesiculosa]|uniref:RRM domain-containing protein n=1 Tax=Hesseltinella vesiculosa TaxID=101127 RepID=A0A1X2G8H0_9FUNG|nr:hypothetical protein DM01DRAFT_1338969 [Hesseltinella vesiculosa]
MTTNVYSNEVYGYEDASSSKMMINSTYSPNGNGLYNANTPLSPSPPFIHSTVGSPSPSVASTYSSHPPHPYHVMSSAPTPSSSLPCHRTVYLGNLAPNTHIGDILDQVKTGMLEAVRPLPEKSCIFLSFVDPAAALQFYQDATAHPFSVHGIDLKVGWGKQSAVPANVRTAILQTNASRTVFLGSLDESVNEDVIREDLQRFGDIEHVKLIREKNIAFVHFLTITNAIKCVHDLPLSGDWQHRRIAYGRDRCAPHHPSNVSPPLMTASSSTTSSTHQPQPHHQTTYLMPTPPPMTMSSSTLTSHSTGPTPTPTQQQQIPSNTNAATATVIMPQPHPYSQPYPVYPTSAANANVYTTSPYSFIHHHHPAATAYQVRYDQRTGATIETFTTSHPHPLPAASPATVSVYDHPPTMVLHHPSASAPALPYPGPTHLPHPHHANSSSSLPSHSSTSLSPSSGSPMPTPSTISAPTTTIANPHHLMSMANRTIYLGNIHPDTTCEDICNVVRGGILSQIRYMPEKHIAFIAFVDPVLAYHFYQQTVDHPLMVKSRRLKVGWGKPSTLPLPVVQAVMNGGSRNVYLGNMDDSITEEKLKQDFVQYGDIELINTLREKNCAFVNFTSISAAIRAIDGIRSKEEYKQFRINFGKDRCGNAPRQPLTSSVQHSPSDDLANASAPRLPTTPTTSAAAGSATVVPAAHSIPSTSSPCSPALSTSSTLSHPPHDLSASVPALSQHPPQKASASSSLPTSTIPSS